MFIDFRKRGRESEQEQEKHWCEREISMVASCTLPEQGSTLQPSGIQADPPTHWATRPGPNWPFFSHAFHMLFSQNTNLKIPHPAPRVKPKFPSLAFSDCYQHAFPSLSPKTCLPAPSHTKLHTLPQVHHSLLCLCSSEPFSWWVNILVPSSLPMESISIFKILLPWSLPDFPTEVNFFFLISIISPFTESMVCIAMNCIHIWLLQDSKFCEGRQGLYFGAPCRKQHMPCT